MHQASYVGDHLLHVVGGGVDVGGRRGRVAVDQQPGRLQPEHHAAERRAETVVQVAADPAALLLAGDDQPLAALLQLVGQPAGAGSGGGLPDQVAEQLLVAAARAGCAARGPAAPAGRPPRRGR